MALAYNVITKNILGDCVRAFFKFRELKTNASLPIEIILFQSRSDPEIWELYKKEFRLSPYKYPDCPRIKSPLLMLSQCSDCKQFHCNFLAFIIDSAGPELNTKDEKKICWLCFLEKGDKRSPFNSIYINYHEIMDL